MTERKPESIKPTGASPWRNGKTEDEDDGPVSANQNRGRLEPLQSILSRRNGRKFEQKAAKETKADGRSGYPSWSSRKAFGASPIVLIVLAASPNAVGRSPTERPRGQRKRVRRRAERIRSLALCFLCCLLFKSSSIASVGL